MTENKGSAVQDKAVPTLGMIGGGMKRIFQSATA
jgi:hypothetical protein